MPYKKGESGNPGGRPKDSYGIAEYARSKLPRIIDGLEKIFLDESEPGKIRIAAAQILCDRGLGSVIPSHIMLPPDSSGNTIEGQVIPPMGRVPVEKFLHTQLKREE